MMSSGRWASALTRLNSALRPSTYAPVLAASRGGTSQASRPPMMPESTSPLPPFESRELPVELIHTSLPSLITLSCPFRTSTQSCSAAYSRQSRAEWALISSAPSPVIAANSPVCGVSTARPLKPPVPDAHFSPSASSTMRQSVSSRRKRTQLPASPSAIPMPTAKEVALCDRRSAVSRSKAMPPPLDGRGKIAE